MDFPTFTNGDSRSALADFIRKTRDFLAELVQSNTDPRGEPLFYAELLPELRVAWDEAYPMFEPIAQSTHNLSSQAINDHGLYGAQLKFKLSAIRFLHNRYLTLAGKGTLRRLIEAIDTLLKSILGALGAGEGIKEIKEYIEHSLSD